MLGIFCSRGDFFRTHPRILFMSPSIKSLKFRLHQNLGLDNFSFLKELRHSQHTHSSYKSQVVLFSFKRSCLVKESLKWGHENHHYSTNSNKYWAKISIAFLKCIDVLLYIGTLNLQLFAWLGNHLVCRNFDGSSNMSQNLLTAKIKLEVLKFMRIIFAPARWLSLEIILNSESLLLSGKFLLQQHRVNVFKIIV